MILDNQRLATATVRPGVQPGKLSSSNGIATGGASLVADDAAGKTDQDWGKGSTPCSSGDLSDGGGSGSHGNCSGPHPGGDSAAEVAHASTGLMLVRR